MNKILLYLLSVVIMLAFFSWGNTVEIEEIQEYEIPFEQADEPAGIALGRERPSQTEYGVYKKELKTEWGQVSYEILVNSHHTGAVIINKINYLDTDYFITEGAEGLYDTYLSNACANLKMYYVKEENDTEFPVFGIDRDPTYRHIFHLAESAIIEHYRY